MLQSISSIKEEQIKHLLFFFEKEKHMEERNLLHDNLEYFEQELLPYYVLLYAKNGVIVIDIRKENLKHLLGISHTTSTLGSLPAKKIYERIKSNQYDLFDLIDYDRFINEQLYYEEELIYKKNYHFKEAFNSLLSSPNLYLYQKQYSTGDFDTDYIHFELIMGYGLYIGICGDENSNFHYFNSIFAEYQNPEKYKNGTRISITKIEKILKDDFNSENYRVMISRHFKSKNLKSTKVKAIDYKRLKTKINKILIEYDMSITIGTYGKNSIQVYKDNECIDKRADIPKKLSSEIEIATYIISKYK